MSTKTTINIFICRLVGYSSILLLNFVIAKIVSTESFGIYNYAMTIVGVCGIASTLGIPDSSLRLIPEYNRYKSKLLLNGYLCWSIKTVVVVSLLVSFALLIFMESFELNSNMKLSVMMSSTFLPFVSFGLLRMKLLRAFGFVYRALVPDEVFFPLISILLLTVIYLVSGEDSVKMVWLVQFVSYVCAFILGYFVLKNKVGFSTWKNKKIKSNIESKWLWFSLPMVGAVLIQLAFDRTDVLMLGCLKGMFDVGVYGVALKISMTILFILRVVNLAVAPVFSKLYLENNFDALKKVLFKCVFISFVVTFPVFLFILMFNVKILEVVGVEYVVGSNVLSVLSFGALFNACTGPVSYFMMMTNRQNILFKKLFKYLMFNIFLNYFLINRYGMVGAAISSSVLTVILNIELMIQSLKVLRVGAVRFG